MTDPTMIDFLLVTVFAVAIWLFTAFKSSFAFALLGTAISVGLLFVVGAYTYNSGSLGSQVAYTSSGFVQNLQSGNLLVLIPLALGVMEVGWGIIRAVKAGD